MNTDQDFLYRLEDSKSLLDVMLAIEDLLDGLDIYVYTNWLKGEVVEGPIVARYWISIALRYNYTNMPDPAAIGRLAKHGIEVKYIQAVQEVFIDEEEIEQVRSSAALGINPNDPWANQNQSLEDKTPKPKKVKIWMVWLSIPRRFIEDVIDSNLDKYEQHIESDDVSDAVDSGISDKSEFTKVDDEEQEEDNEEDI